MILIFISIIKIVQKSFEKSPFLYCAVFVLHCRIFRQIKQTALLRDCQSRICHTYKDYDQK